MQVSHNLVFDLRTLMKNESEHIPEILELKTNLEVNFSENLWDVDSIKSIIVVKFNWTVTSVQSLSDLLFKIKNIRQVMIPYDPVLLNALRNCLEKLFVETPNHIKIGYWGVQECQIETVYQNIHQPDFFCNRLVRNDISVFRHYNDIVYCPCNYEPEKYQCTDWIIRINVREEKRMIWLDSRYIIR